jgi:hypothetical protein
MPVVERLGCIERKADRGRQEDTQADEKLLARTRLRISGKHSVYAGMDRSDAGHPDCKGK